MPGVSNPGPGPAVWVLITALGVVWGCSCDRPVPPADSSPPADLVPDRPPSPDLPGPDRGPPDLASDLPTPDLAKRDFGKVDPKVCGGSRKLLPKPVVKYTPTPCGKACKQLTFGNSVNLDYEVAGDLLVYIGKFYVSGTGLSDKVYYVDLKTGTEWRLHDDIKSSYSHGCHRVSTDGKVVAYTCVRDGWQVKPVTQWLRSVTTWDPNTKMERDLHCVPRYVADDICYPPGIAVGSTGIGLTMSLTACIKGDVQFYRFSDKSFTNVSKQYGSLGHLTMWAHRMAWIRGYQAEVYDTKTGKGHALSPSKTGQCFPRIEGDRVVWNSCYNTKDPDVYLHDLSTGKTMKVTDHPAKQQNPDVEGDWVVWQDDRSKTGNHIYAKNVKTNKELQLTSGHGYRTNPRISDGKVYYVMTSKKHPSVYVVDLKTFQKP